MNIAAIQMLATVGQSSIKQYCSIVKKKRLFPKTRCPETLKQKNLINEQIVQYRKPVQFSKINIFNQSQSFEVQQSRKTIEHQKYLSQRVWQGKDYSRLKTEKIGGKSIGASSVSSKKIIYLRTKSKKVLNKTNRTERISQLNITQKKLDKRPTTANGRDYWTISVHENSKKKPKQQQQQKTPRLVKKTSILSPW